MPTLSYPAMTPEALCALADTGDEQALMELGHRARKLERLKELQVVALVLRQMAAIEAREKVNLPDQDTRDSAS